MPWNRSLMRLVVKYKKCVKKWIIDKKTFGKQNGHTITHITLGANIKRPD